MGTRATWIIGGIMMLAGACDEDSFTDLDDIVDGDIEPRDEQYNNIWLNNIWLNNIWLNNIWLNGFDLSGDPLPGPAGASDSIAVTDADADVWLVGSEVHAQNGNGAVKSGSHINNLKVEFDITEGGTFKKKTLRISSAAQLGSGVWTYDVDYKLGGGPWSPLCVADDGSTTQAIFIGGVWNATTGARRQVASTSVTVACRGAALAKCVEWGYHPWASVNNTSLQDYHQACTRMVRADYCGEGVPHTAAGTPIHVLDQVGIQNVAPNVSYVVEAEWGPNGATCLNTGNTRLANQNIACQLPACGSSFSSGGLIQSGKVLSGP